MTFSGQVQERHAQWVWRIDDLSQGESRAYSMSLEGESVPELQTSLREKLGLLQDAGKVCVQLYFCLIVQRGTEMLMDELSDLTYSIECFGHDGMEVTFGYAVNAVQEHKLYLAVVAIVE